MLTQDDLQAIGKLIKDEVNPLKKDVKHIKEDLEITKSKVSSTAAKVGVMYIQIRDIKDKQSVLNEKFDDLDTKVEEGFARLEDKINTTFKYVSNVDKDFEKRLKKIESKLNLKPNPTI